MGRVLFFKKKSKRQKWLKKYEKSNENKGSNQKEKDDKVIVSKRRGWH